MLDNRHHSKSYKTCKICGGPIKFKSLETVDGLPVAECLNCGLLFVRNVPSKKLCSDTDDFVEKYYTEISTDKSKFIYSLNLIKSCLDNQNRKMEGQRLLDVGCGDGYFISLCQNLGIESYGYDISPAAVNYAKNKGLKVLTDLDKITNKFDIITMFDVLEHMENPRRELEDLAKLLKDNGLIFIETPRKCLADFYLSVLELFGMARNNRVSSEHLQLFTNNSLRILLDKVQYKIIYFQSKTSFSWGGTKGISQYVNNIGIIKPLNWFVTVVVKLLIRLNMFGKNKAIILATLK
jgi:2-polyprenyl-3-methyl-5-hydroxy-6-metoxy-1,4-benzoquinol methylase